VNSDWFSDSVASKEEGNEVSSLLLNKDAYGETNLHSSADILRIAKWRMR
jgi:hypothetical protein